MIPCSKCGKSFIFAEVVEIDHTYEALATRGFVTRGLPIDEACVARQTAWMRSSIADLPLGATVVHLDCRYFEVGERSLEFTGEFATHRFDTLPHALALNDPSILRAVLGESRYWRERERPDRDDDHD